MKKTAFAIASHPDDIDYMMAGTLVALKNAGYEIHYMNIANGSCGTNQYDRETIIAMRREEAKKSSGIIGAVFHESLCDDLEVFYTKDLLERLIPVVREVNPEIVLTHGPYDYMEDHVNSGRLAVSAAFCRGMVPAPCVPPVPAVNSKVTVYHSMPHSITDALRRPVVPGLFVNVGEAIELKKQMLACHISQGAWLDSSQGSAFVDDMVKRGRYFGKMSGKYEYAEGWVRHSHIGFCDSGDDPLTAALGGKAMINEAFEKANKIDFWDM
jgi:LmbE family N-acetylglucosaminyl deacetylase